MAKITILIALLPHLLCTMVQGQPSSCSEYFTYMTKPGITDMLGQIETPPPSINDEFYLKVALTTTTELPSQVVRLELAQSIQESVLAVSRGRSLLYHVYYPTHEPIPSLSAIWFNNHRYCPANGNISATIELGHILYPPNEQPLVYSYGPWQQISQPWHRNSSIYRIDNPNYDHLNYNYGLNECGITSYYTDDINRQIPNGEKAYPGQWPWLVAIYVQDTDNENEYSFECAGSILTNRHVITDEACILRWNETLGRRTFIQPQRVYVSFGQLISREWHGNHTGIINRVIAKYTYNNILLILNLKTPVEYNAFIRPVCLWSGSTDLQDIVNMTGYIVGWGHDVDRSCGGAIFLAAVSQYRHILQTLYKICCLSTIRNWWHILLKIYFYRYTSFKPYPYTEEPRTLKVPLRDISERTEGALKTIVVPMSHTNVRPCDRGSGFVVSNIHTGRYQLRGVANLCVSPNFNIYYIDIVNHISWIRHQISNT